MINFRNLFGGAIGVALSFTGTAISTTTVSEIVSIITGVLGLVIVIVTSIIIPLVRWWIKAKKDGKIDDDEIIELADTIENGVDKVNSQINEGKEKK